MANLLAERTDRIEGTGGSMNTTVVLAPNGQITCITRTWTKVK